ncbi:LANO_0C07712g1_1 [Lachancea nothofagi CBS 11611]|uniref:TBP-associated factor 12 n=1 Tax=Lachancea nothofagi CBS 11611 TaxID=1266666 RepID=A0A1G4J9F2_9SACH|nr:LANO_0C07712g1_1 [Lachancea nothofagi CBS 11611]
MSSNANSGQPAQGGNNLQGPQTQQLTPDSVQQLALRYRQYFNEAQRVGTTTPQGQELLRRASKIKAMYVAYNTQTQQANQGHAQGSSGALGAAENSSASPTASQASNGTPTSNSISSNIQNLLTPQQNEAYGRLIQTFNENGEKIKGEYGYLKKQIEILDGEIKKRQSNPATVNQLETKKSEILNKLTGFGVSFRALSQKLREDKKNFYIECAATNANLKRFLQASTQQQRANASNMQSAASPMTANTSQANATTPVQQTTATQPPSQQQGNGTPVQPRSGASSRSPTQVTSVNAAAHLANSASPAGRQAIFKQPNPSVPISETVSQKMPTPVVHRSNRPTITGGSAMNAAALNTPVMTKLPPYEVDNERVMSKRKLRELVKSVGIDEGDGETTIDGDVEELLLDLADDFITNVTSFACRLAKHRKSDNLDVRDIQLHLERNWNIRVPGYAADEVRSTRKWNPATSYNQKIQGINSAKAAKSATAAQAAAAQAVTGNVDTKNQSMP